MLLLNYNLRFIRIYLDILLLNTLLDELLGDAFAVLGGLLVS
jgi:hypothetical protein